MFRCYSQAQTCPSLPKHKAIGSTSLTLFELRIKQGWAWPVHGWRTIRDSQDWRLDWEENTSIV